MMHLFFSIFNDKEEGIYTAHLNSVLVGVCMCIVCVCLCVCVYVCMGMVCVWMFGGVGNQATRKCWHLCGLWHSHTA